MKTEFQRILNDPRLVTLKHNGEDLHFWYHRRGSLIAEKHGYTGDIENEVEGVTAEHFGDRLLRFMWICHLPFDPDMSFDEFDLMFLPGDYAKLGSACAEVVNHQLPKPEKESGETPKKGKSRTKMK